MQRITPWGLNDWNELEFIGKFDQHQVNIVYRQSPKLLRVAGLLYEKIIGTKPPFKSAFHDSEADQHPLRVHINNDQSLGEWISKRLVEIYQINGKLPSTAIFVAEDEQIADVVTTLKEPLNENSFMIRGCPRGEILGVEGKVGVFSIKYIKGLEFESVFFVNIDQIAAKVPELIDKYLYVGLTRASSFLAVTYSTEFPEKIHFVKDYFREGDWSKLVR